MGLITRGLTKAMVTRPSEGREEGQVGGVQGSKRKQGNSLAAAAHSKNDGRIRGRRRGQKPTHELWVLPFEVM